MTTPARATPEEALSAYAASLRDGPLSDDVRPVVRRCIVPGRLTLAEAAE